MYSLNMLPAVLIWNLSTYKSHNFRSAIEFKPNFTSEEKKLAYEIILCTVQCLLLCISEPFHSRMRTISLEAGQLDMFSAVSFGHFKEMAAYHRKLPQIGPDLLSPILFYIY